MLDLSFSYNWNNKLDCRAFTTIRLYNAHKHAPGTPVRILLKGTELSTGTIGQVKTMYLNQINEYIARLDTGYSAQECRDIIRKMYPSVNFDQQQLALLLIVKDTTIEK